MNQPLHISAFLPRELTAALSHPAGDRRPFVTPALPQDRCTSRICFAPRRGAFGHFVADADALAQAVSGQFPACDLESPDSPEATMYRYLRDNDRHDSSLTTLPPDWPGLEAAIEQTFQRGAARAFCLACNRNYLRPHTRFHRRPACSQYVCPEGHLLLSIPEAAHNPALETAFAA